MLHTWRIHRPIEEFHVPDSPPDVGSDSRAERLAPLRPSVGAQWLVLISAIVSALVVAAGFSAVAALTAPQDEVLTAGARVSAGGVSIEPADGWVLSGESGDIFDIAKQEAQILIFPPTTSTKTAAEGVDELADIFRADTAAGTQVTEVQTFETSAGLQGAKAVAVEPENVTLIYAFSDGEQLTKSQVSLSGSAWKELGPEIDDMMATVEFEAGAGS
jgi:hypothetical protein